MKKVKRFICVLLVCCLITGLLPSTALAAGNHHPFADVSDRSWYNDAVQYVYEHGMMNGTDNTEFSPDVSTSRGMIVTILHRMEGAPAAASTTFTDVQSGKYYSDAVAWANANDIVNGYGNGLFGPDDTITREQMATILYRYAEYKQYDVNIYDDISTFSDSSQVSSWAVEPVKWAFGIKLITGVGENMLDPTGDATRAQVAMILMRFCQKSALSMCSVTFDLNYEGAESLAVVRVETGKTVDAPVSPSRSGYTFDGWYTAPSGGDRFSFNTIIRSDLVLYAHWSVASSGGGYIPSAPSKKFTVTFDLNDGSASIYRTVTVSSNETVSAPTPNPERNLYAFTGWYMEPATETQYDFSAPVVSDMTLYAGWGDPNRSTDSLYAATDETETIYSISDITVNGNNVTVTYNTNKVALLFVEFFPDKMADGEWTEDNLNSNLALKSVATASGYTEHYGELISITLPISDTLPEHYLVRASLLENGQGSVNDALATYVTAQYTSTYSKFETQTVNDFEEDLVINFDEDTTTNFGVMKDSVIVIPSACRFANNKELKVEDIEGEDIYAGGEEYKPQMEKLVPDHRFTFPDRNAIISTDEENKNLTLADLNSGDIIYIEGTTWMFKIKEKTINNDGSISFTQDKNTTMTDYYDVLKVDFEGAEPKETDIMPVWEIIDINESGSVSIGPFKVENEFSNGVKLSGSFSGKVTGKVTMLYDAHLFSENYFEASVIFSTNITGEVKADVGTDNNNEYKNVVYQVDTRKVKLATPVAGLDIYVKPAAQINWNLSGDVSIKWTNEQTSGFKYNSDDGYKEIAKKENTVNIMAKGKAEAKIGPIIDIGIEFLDGVLSGGIVAEAGAKVTSDATVHIDDDVLNTVDAKHACDLCIAGKAEWYASVSAKFKYKITNNFKGDIINAEILDYTVPVKFDAFSGEFFVSVLNSVDSPFGGNIKFGGGKCTNKTYRTEFKIHDQNGQDINGIQISVVKQGQTVGKVGVSPYVEYLYEGTYTSSANLKGTSISKIVEVSGKPQIVILTADDIIKTERNITATLDTARLIAGDTAQIIIEDNAENDSPSYICSVDNSEVATVTETTVTAISEGSATITIFAPETPNYKSGSATVDIMVVAKDLSSLEKLETPTDLMWGRYYGVHETEPSAVPGMISWKNAQDKVRIKIYREGTDLPVREFTHSSGEGYPTAYRSDPDFVETDLGSGTYYFTVQAVGDGIRYADSDIATSGTWTYNQPEAKLPPITAGTWNGPIASWPEIVNDYFGWYHVEVLFSDTLDGKLDRASGVSGLNYASMEIGYDFVPNEGPGYYYFRVRAISNDITVMQNSDWSELSPAYYLDDTYGTIKTPLGMIEETLGRKEVKSAAWNSGKDIQQRVVMLAD